MASLLAGRRVLIVEDEAIVAILLEDIVEEIGCTIVGPVSKVVHAVAALENERVDAAILDVNLAGEWSYPIADALAARGIPYVFVTGYGEAGIDAAYRSQLVVQKPFTRLSLESALERLIAPPA
ncbi:response regulator [Novosphingobium sp. BL-8H]|uniref:response regulator n=1 Tax=Novosphingobium sp. BL-8H TaxID=3127640 RepID=UPI00375768B4